VVVKRKRWLLAVLVLMALPGFAGGCEKADGSPPVKDGTTIALPEPAYDSETSLEEAILQRRSVREYEQGTLTLAELGQLLWAAQGITDADGKRSAPSAGALYPLEIYIVVGNVEGVSTGVYKYRPESHGLVKISDGDQREALCGAALNQSSVNQGAIDIVITAVYERVTGKYGERGVRYTHLEAGHAAQNVCLQAVALKLGTVTIGAFEDDAVKEILGAADDEEPLYILPVGRSGN
jgi:SagB-type dehydrogenase family enzyme